MSHDESPFSGRNWVLDVAAIGNNKSGEIAASNQECEAAAKALALLGCRNVRFGYSVQSLPQHRFRLKSHLWADVTQACVVTLDPVPATLDETAESELEPEGSAKPEAVDGETEIMSAPIIDTYSGGRIDLGKIAFELLSVSLDPYPRAGGQEAPLDVTEGANISPFAALARLRKE